MGAGPSAQGGRPRPERDLRAERAAALARRGAAAAATDSGVDHLVCACGGERYGVPLAAVAQVLPSRPATPMPGAVPALDGLVALSGRIVGVLSLARALGRPDPASDADAAAHMIVLRGVHPQPLALAVDRVLGIARAPGAVAAAGAGAADPDRLGNEAASVYAPASGAAGDGRPDFVVIDLPRLLRRALP
ncbi:MULTISPECIES: chemotaxis protein CheW [Methylobacterium]|uniref:chemotaxis protein CheW n=1 Tax=Methylobacterium TaxID=407 RepID=UPI000378C408|nr:MULTISPECIES: chemotaxis protein CheW [Methylobacterium]MBN4095744.1 chemotaxis protein CheW [Methylobacterium sp. OT2]UIN37243.1 chemotaxis protein CheW [Methylobacterium oryzae]SEF99594.1 purine-binding chemotaxis protein CheW [Methylobacterium sp. 190mf]